MREGVGHSAQASENGAAHPTTAVEQVLVSEGILAFQVLYFAKLGRTCG